MRRSTFLTSTSLAFLMVLSGSVRAETKVEIKGVHLCCAACVKAVGETLKKVEGVTGVCDQKGRTITLTAKDDATAQKAIDALASAGFEGNTGRKDLAAKDDSGVTKGTVKSLTVTGVHNCCGSCTRIIKETLKSVKGVTGDDVKARTTTFTVTGEFDAAELVKALNAAGFHLKVQK